MAVSYPCNFRPNIKLDELTVFNIKPKLALAQPVKLIVIEDNKEAIKFSNAITNARIKVWQLNTLMANPDSQQRLCFDSFLLIAVQQMANSLNYTEDFVQLLRKKNIEDYPTILTTSKLIETCQAYLKKIFENNFDPKQVKFEIKQIQDDLQLLKSKLFQFNVTDSNPNKNLNLVKDMLLNYIVELYDFSLKLENHHNQLSVNRQLQLSSACTTSQQKYKSRGFITNGEKSSSTRVGCSSACLIM